MPDLLKSKLGLPSVIAGAIALIGWSLWLGAQNARLEGQLQSLTTTSGDHETRIRVVETGLSDMKGDIKVIRQILEQGHKSE